MGQFKEKSLPLLDDLLNDKVDEHEFKLKAIRQSIKNKITETVPGVRGTGWMINQIQQYMLKYKTFPSLEKLIYWGSKDPTQ